MLIQAMVMLTLAMFNVVAVVVVAFVTVGLVGWVS